MSILNAKGIDFKYPSSSWILKDVDIELRSGEILGIVAPSGYGKSTLARVLAGYEKQQQGTVTIDGEAIQTKGYYPVQLIYQHPEKTFNPRWKMKHSLNEGWAVDEETIRSMGIRSDWLERWPNELSGGEQQRFSIARSLGPETKFLIADEISTMLDAVTQAQIWTLLVSIAKERNIGIIAISHSPSLLTQVCDRIIDLREINHR